MPDFGYLSKVYKPCHKVNTWKKVRFNGNEGADQIKRIKHFLLPCSLRIYCCGCCSFPGFIELCKNFIFAGRFLYVCYFGRVTWWGWGSQDLKVTELKKVAMAQIDMTLRHVNFARQMESLDLMISENHVRDITLLPRKVADLGQSSIAEIKGGNQSASGLNEGWQ